MPESTPATEKSATRCATMSVDFDHTKDSPSLELKHTHAQLKSALALYYR